MTSAPDHLDHNQEVVDCRGMKCPRPIIELVRRIADLEPGTQIVLLADDPAADPDLLAWCRMTGHHLISRDPPRFVVEKGFVVEKS